MVCDEHKFSSSEVGGKMVHAPNGSLHLKQKRCVVAFVLLHISACICDDTMFTFVIDLCKNGPKAPWFSVVAEAGVDDQGIGPVSSRVINDWL